MSSTIDERVVELKFDNKDFEQNVKVSMNTLDYLKTKLDTLDGTKAGVESINNSLKKMNFSGVANNVETIASRFSLLGTIGKGALEAVGAGIVNVGKSLVSKLMAPLNQIKSGGMARALNIEQAKFQLKGLGLAVEEVMDDVSFAVDGTAYGLDEAAIVASQFGASGVKAGEQMKHGLLAVAGAAAMTGRGFGEIGQIFTTVAGQGKIMTMQLRQFEARGLNAAAAMAKIMNKSEDQVRELVHEGKISFEQFSDMMYQSFGEHAKAANDTFTGSLSNMKAALSRIGADFATPYTENMKQVLHTTRSFIDDFRKTITRPIAEGAFTDMMDNVRKFFNLLDLMGTRKNIITGLGDAFRVLQQVMHPINVAFKQMGFTVDNLSKLIFRWSENFKRATKDISLTGTAAEDLRDAVKGIITLFKIFGNVIKSVLNALLPTGSSINSLAGTIVHILGVLGRLIMALDKIIEESKVLDSVTTAIRTAVTILVTALITAVTYILRFAGGIGTVLLSLKDFVVQSRLLEMVLNSGLVKGITFIIYKLQTFIKMIKNTVTVFKTLYSQTGNLSKALSGSFGSIFGDIKGQFSDSFISGVSTLAEKLKALAVSIKDVIVNFIEFRSTASNATRSISGFDSPVRSMTSNINIFSGIIKTVTAIMKGFATAFGLVIKVAGPSVIKALSAAFHILVDAIDMVGNAMQSFSLKDFVNDGGMAKIAMIALAVAMGVVLAAVLKLVAAMGSLMLAAANALNGVSSAIQGFTNIERKVAEVIESYKKAKPSLIKEIGVSIALIAASLWVLSKVPINDLRQVTLWLGGFMAVMMILGKLTNVETSGKLTGLGVSMVALAAGVYILIKAFNNLNAIDFSKAGNNVAVLLALMAGLGLMASIMSVIAPKLSTGGLVLLSFGIAVKNMVDALVLLDSVNWNNLQQSVGALLVVCLSLAAVGRAAGSMSVGSAIGFLAFILELKLLLSVIKELATGDLEHVASLGNVIIDNFKQFGAIIAVMAAVAFIVTKSAAAFAKLGVAMTLIALSLLIFKKAIEAMASLNPDTLGQGVAVISAIMLLSAGLMAASALTKKAKLISFGVMLAIMSSCMVAMAFVMDYIGHLKPDVFKQGMLAITGIMGMVAILMAASYATKGASIKGVIAIMALLATAMAEMALLSLIPYDKLLGAAASMTAVIVALSLLVNQFTKLQKGTGGIVWGTLIASIIAMASVGAAIWALTKFSDSGDEMLKAGAALALGLTGMSFAIRAFEKLNGIKIDKSVILAMTALIVPILGLAAGLSLMGAAFAKSGASWKVILASTVPMSASLIALGKMLAELNKLNGVTFDKSIILAMVASAVPIMAIGMAMQFLPSIPWQNIAAAAVPMSTCLLALGEGLSFMAKLNGVTFDNSVLLAIVTMSVPIMAIGMSLQFLPSVPWQNIAAAAVPMGACLLAMGEAIAIMSSVEKIDNSVLIAMGIAAGQILAVGLALSLVANVPWQSLLAATVPMTAVMLAMAIAVTAVSQAGRIDPTVLIAMGVAAVQVVAIGAALMMVAKVPWQNILAATIAMSTVMAVMAVAIIAVSAVKVSPGAILGMVAAAIEIVAIGHALAQVAQFDWKQILASVIAVNAVMSFVTGLFLIISIIASTGVGTAGVAVAALGIVSVGAALYLVGAGLSKLAEFDWKNIAATALSIIAVMGVVTALFAAIALLASTGVGTVGVAVAAAGILAIGAAILMVGSGAKMCAEGIQILVNAFQDLASTFAIDTQIIMIGLTNLGTGIATFIQLVTSSVAQGISDIALAIAQGIASISVSITNGINMISQAIGLGIATIFLTALTGIIAGIADLISTIATGGQQVNTEAQGIGVTLETTIKNFDLKKAAIEVGKDVLKGLIEGLMNQTLMGRAITTAASIGSKVIAGIRSANGVDAHSPSRKGEKIGMDVDSGIESGLKKGLGSLKTTSAQIGKDTIGGIVTEIKKGEAPTKALGKAFDGLKQKANDAGITTEKLTGFVGDLTSGNFNLLETIDGLTGGELGLSQALGSTSEAMDGASNSTNGYTESTGKAKDKTKEMTEELAKYVDSLSQKIESSMDIFSEWTDKEAISADKMLSNMRSQIKGVMDWSKNIASLAAKGLDEGLIQKLADLGPQGADKVAAFASMTNEQILEANQLFQQSLMLPDAAATYITSSFTGIGADILQGLLNGMDSRKSKEAGFVLGKAAVDGTAEGAGCQSPSTITYETGNNIDEGLKKGLEDNSKKAESAAETVGKRTVNVFKKMKLPDQFRRVANECMNGFIIGLSEKEEELDIKIKIIGEKVKKAIQESQQVESPSKFWRWIGNMDGEGLVRGLEDYRSKVTNAASDLGDAANNSLGGSISKVIDDMSENGDFVIRPTLDLSLLTAQAQSIGSILNSNALLRASNQQTILAAANARTQQQPTQVFNQYNTSPKALSETEIYRQTKNLFSTAKG